MRPPGYSAAPCFAVAAIDKVPLKNWRTNQKTKRITAGIFNHRKIKKDWHQGYRRVQRETR